MKVAKVYERMANLRTNFGPVNPQADAVPGIVFGKSEHRWPGENQAGKVDARRRIRSSHRAVEVQIVVERNACPASRPFLSLHPTVLPLWIPKQKPPSLRSRVGMPGVQHQAPRGSERSLQPERRRYKATRRYGNPRDTKRLWTACKTHDSGQRCVKQESPGFGPGEVQYRGGRQVRNVTIAEVVIILVSEGKHGRSYLRRTES